MAVEAVDLLYRPLELLLTPENMSAASEVVLPKSNLSEDKYMIGAGLGKPCARERPRVMSVSCVSRGMMEKDPRTRIAFSLHPKAANTMATVR
jgi:hypothetical protein